MEQLASYLQITSGQGPQECSLAVSKCLGRMAQEARDAGLTMDIVEQHMDGNFICSALLHIRGGGHRAFVERWIGTIQWICASPYRPFHKRKNWFIAVFLVEKSSTIALDIGDIAFQAMRSSGAGGQHVNKVSSAIRATHTPTGLSVQVMDTRSQLQNKKLAIDRLQMKLHLIQQQHQYAEIAQKWTNQLALQRGSPIRIFRTERFTEK